jgi:hypothetical protein
MSNITGEPFEPIDDSSPGEGRGVPLRWWQMLLILSPFAALIVLDILYRK